MGKQITLDIATLIKHLYVKQIPLRRKTKKL